MKKLFILFILIFITGCKDEKSVAVFESKEIVQTKIPQSTELSLLENTSVDEFFAVIFKCPLDKNEWSDLFKTTDRLSELRNHPINYEDPNFSQYYLDSTSIITKIFDQYSAYMFDWSATENCKFENINNELSLRCDPDYETWAKNSLNGGLPEAVSKIEFKKPTKKDRDQTSWIEFKMQSKNENYGSFDFKVKLRFEEIKNNIKLFRGDLIIEDGFDIIKEKSALSYCNYGYVELRVH